MGQKRAYPKKELASIIELTGELPQPGTGFKATKSGNQYEMQFNDAFSAWGNAMECDEMVEITPLILKYTSGQQARILQNTKNGSIMLINERFVEMIDNTAINYEDGETQAEGPLIHRKYQGAFWRNERMALYVYPRTDDENKRLLGYLEVFDIMSRGEKWDERRLLGYGISEDGKEKETEET